MSKERGLCYLTRVDRISVRVLLVAFLRVFATRIAHRLMTGNQVSRKAPQGLSPLPSTSVLVKQKFSGRATSVSGNLHQRDDFSLSFGDRVYVIQGMNKRKWLGTVAILNENFYHRSGDKLKEL